MVLAPPSRHSNTIDRGIDELPIEDIPRNNIEQIIGSTNGQLYFFERVNLSKNYSDYIDSKAEFLTQIFQGNSIRGVESIWSLSLELVEQIESENPNNFNSSDIDIFLVGYLVKQDENFTEVAKARFFLEVESGLIAYHLVQREINEKQFRQYFCQIIEDTAINFSANVAVSVCPLDKTNDYLLQEISQLEALSKVEIYLNPSNPSTKRYWRNIDSKLHDLEIAKSQEIIEASPGHSINISGLLRDDLFREKVLMASDGYGIVRATGAKPTSIYFEFEDNESEMDGDLIISTGDQPIVTRIMEDNEEPRNVLVVLLAFFRQLKKADDYDEE